MASKRHLRRRQCESKRAYKDQTEAVRAIIRLRRIDGLQRFVEAAGRPVRSYRCSFCGQWHLGHVSNVSVIRKRGY